MASASCEIKFGLRSSAEPGTTNSVSCATSFGIASAASPVAWAGNEPVRAVADWLPRIDQPVIDSRTGKFTKEWWNFFRVLGERVGGIQGPSFTEVADTVTQTQAQVAVNTAYTDAAIAYTASVAATTQATAEVAQSNGLSGASSIPPPSRPPNRPNYQVE